MAAGTVVLRARAHGGSRFERRFGRKFVALRRAADGLVRVLQALWHGGYRHKAVVDHRGKVFRALVVRNQIELDRFFV